jgi:hypothetical protein
LQLDAVTQNLDRAERQVLALLAEREATVSRLVAETEASQRKQTELEQARQQQNAVVEEAARVPQATIDRAHARIAKDAAYLTQQQKAQNAVSMVSAAEEKAKLAEANKEEKGKPCGSGDQWTAAVAGKRSTQA